MTRNPGRGQTVPRHWPTRLKERAQKSCRFWARVPRERRRICIAGRGCSKNCFAFIARLAQTTAVHYSQLPRIGSRSGQKVVLRYRVSRRPNRSGLRGSRIVRRFSDYLLHGSRTGVVFSPGSGGRNSRLPPRFAQAITQSTLRAVSECLALLARAYSLLSLP